MNTDTMNEKQKKIWDRFLTRVCKCDRRWPEVEKFVIKSPEYASCYAENAIKGRWPEAEGTIIESALWAYRYAAYVIEGRWPEAEETIIESPKYACWYAENVIKGRWPEAEETIRKDPEWACDYARFVIKGRWPEAEETIVKSEANAFLYARHVIEGRWPEAEETIRLWAPEYLQTFRFSKRSASLESNYLCHTSLCKLSTVRDYVSEVDWSDPANDFPIPKRLKDVLKKQLCVAK